MGSPLGSTRLVAHAAPLVIVVSAVAVVVVQVALVAVRAGRG